MDEDLDVLAHRAWPLIGKAVYSYGEPKTAGLP